MLATEREPEGQPLRARGDDEASVARSAARGAYRHHHSTQHCAAQQPRHCIRLAQDFVVVKIFLSGILGIKDFSYSHDFAV